MSNKLEITKILSICTSHITEETANMLTEEPESNKMMLSVYPFPYGYFIYVGSFASNEEHVNESNIYAKYDMDNITLDKIDIIPDELKKCICLAVKNGCTWLQLDRDADEVDELPVFEW